MGSFPERLKFLRTQKGLSQQALAERLGCVSKSSINMYERGDREPGLETIEAIADFFNVDLDYLLGKSETQSRYRDVILGIEQAKKNEDSNIIRIAGRDGSYQERRLSDEQLAALKAILDQMPDATDDL